MKVSFDENVVRMRLIADKLWLCRAVGEEVVAPVAEVSTTKQLHIIARVQVIADVLRDSLLLRDALRVIVDHFKLTAHADVEIDKDDAKDKTNDPLTVVGYGLGSFCASSNAIHQLGFLVALKRALDDTYWSTAVAKVSTISDRIQNGVEIFDPAMNKVSKSQANCICSWWNVYQM